MNRKRKFSFIVSVIILFAAIVRSTAFGAEIGADSISGVTLPTSQENGESPLNFILDPFMLVYETDAERYGGGIVQEGATLLFHNSSGEYDFSSMSDELTATNQGGNAVNVRVDVSIENLDDVKLKENEEYEEDEVAELYLALIDNSGNEQVLSPDEPTTLQSYLDEGESFSFKLKGSCNPNGDWAQVRSIPSIRVIWEVDPAGFDEDFTEKEECHEDTDVTKEDMEDSSMGQDGEIDDINEIPNDDVIEEDTDVEAGDVETDDPVMDEISSVSENDS